MDPLTYCCPSRCVASYSPIVGELSAKSGIGPAGCGGAQLIQGAVMLAAFCALAWCQERAGASLTVPGACVRVLPLCWQLFLCDAM